MMKFITACVVLSMIIIACHKKAVPTVADRTEQPTAPVKESHPAYAASDIDAGKVVYETKCAKCHPAKPVDAYTEGRWVGILRSMVPKAKLDSMQTIQIIAYVNTNAKK